MHLGQMNPMNDLIKYMGIGVYLNKIMSMHKVVELPDSTIDFAIMQFERFFLNVFGF